MSLITCCSPIVLETKDCGFCRLIESKSLTKGLVDNDTNKERKKERKIKREIEMINVRANNVDCCRCPQKKQLLICKDNKKEYNKIRKRQRGKKYLIF